MTHISFVSMWFSGSLALGVLFQCALFFWIPYWRYFLIFNVCVGLLVTLMGICLLVESPMYLLIIGEVIKASESLEHIKKFNNQGSSRKIDLFDLNQRILRQKLTRRQKSLCHYTCCTANCSNILILVTLQLISSVSVYMLWFEY